ncbi:Fc receptor-like protein 5 [Hyperolius riggenbachi]|uniref:Fc receptor-like protein 5 n=1 Tax=Hyperolius riggenbachi TaxID=752182 RepID=UPI0035A2C51B
MGFALKPAVLMGVVLEVLGLTVLVLRNTDIVAQSFSVFAPPGSILTDRSASAREEARPEKMRQRGMALPEVQREVPPSIARISGKSVKPIVTITPSWSYFYTGESVILTCNDGETQDESDQNYYWYKDYKDIRWYGKQYAFTTEEKHSGLYYCFGSGSYSNGVRLNINSKGSSPAPSVSFDPGWGQIFTGERMTMKCNVQPGATWGGQYSWYRDEKLIEENGEPYTIYSARSDDRGEYQCRDGTGSYSFPIKLDVTKGNLILQAPPITVEGDTLHLRCHSRSIDNENKETYFYKGNININPPGQTGHTLSLNNVNPSMSGEYRCTKQIWDYQTHERKTSIFIEDLFRVAVINNGHDPVIEGDNVTLTCSTWLHPLRQDTQLLYAFYRNGQKVLGFKAFYEYRVVSAQLDDSERYTCEVKTSSGTVKKTSAELLIEVEELNSPEITAHPSLPVEEGRDVTLKCELVPEEIRVLYTFYKDFQIIQHASVENIYEVHEAEAEDTGNYQCSIQYNSLRKNSTSMHILVHYPVSGVNITICNSREDFTLGKSLRLICSVQMGTPLIFRWLHNGKIVEEDPESFQLQNNGSVLYIPSLQRQHEGTYQCNVSSNTLPTSGRTSSAVGEITIPQIMGSHQSGLSPILIIVGVSLLIILLAAIMMFIYRDKIASRFQKSPQRPPNSDSNTEKDNPRVGETPITNREIGSSELSYDGISIYSKVSCPMIDNICYATINIKKMEGSSVSPKNEDEHAVLYSVIKNPGTTLDTQATLETHDTADIYQNIKPH